MRLKKLLPESAHKGIMEGYGYTDEAKARARLVAVRKFLQRGNHEELYAMLRSGEANLVLNDQRRAFSDEYVNLILAVVGSYIEIAGGSLLASLTKITPQELKNTPCILISTEGQKNMDWLQVI